MQDILDNKYYAGFLDGEGCFTVDGTPRVYASNTHLPSLLNLQKQFGGKVRTKCAAQGNSREQFEWYIYGVGAIHVCKTLLPHLREKQAQAALMINHRYETRPAVKAVLSRMIKELKRV